MFRVISLATVGLAMSATAQPRARLAPHASWSVLPWTNGIAGGWFNTETRRLEGFTPRIFAHHDAQRRVPNLVHDAYPGLELDGQRLWLTDAPIRDAHYDAQRGIVTTLQRVNGVSVTSRLWAPFSVNAPIIVWTLEIRNERTAPLAEAALTWLGNFHLGDGPSQTAGERITWRGDHYVEQGALGEVRVFGWPSPTVHAASPSNPYGTVSGGAWETVDDSGVRDDAIMGYRWALPALAPGASTEITIVLGYAAPGQAAGLTRELATLPHDAAQLRAAAVADWDAYLAQARLPASLQPDEAEAARQALTVLRMAQVRQAYDDSATVDGQMVASLPPGMWNIAWVRDQAYALEALVDAGLYAPAARALEFWFREAPGRGTYVCCDNHGQPYVGRPYQLSVVRYFGNGAEESDWNAQGPNVEFDGFGLALALLDAYVVKTGDTQLLQRHRTRVFEKTADVLVSLIESQGPHQGLIRADSSIWETHWYDGGKKHFAYTQATSVRGLRAAARLAAALGETVAAQRYQAAAETIKDATQRLMRSPGGALRGNAEEPAHWLDAAASAALVWGIIAPGSDSARASLAAWDAGLRIPHTGHGYMRNDDGGAYDLREWVAVDLWLADAYRINGNAARADELIAWVTNQAKANYWLIAENYDRYTADYQGEVPMVGFGAGAYIHSLWQRPQPPVAIDTTPGAPSPALMLGGGQGCQAGGTSLAAATLALLWRRRKRAR